VAYLGLQLRSRQPSNVNPCTAMDISADLGEHDGDGYDGDIELLDLVTSASIACGSHAGSVDVMRRTAREANARGVAIGAHPSYPDREGFGRHRVPLAMGDLTETITRQIALLAQCCSEVGARVRYVKPHGALYNQAAEDEGTARAVVRAVREVDDRLVLLALAGSSLAREGLASGLSVAREAFIDRGYMPDGTLVPRGQDGAVLSDNEAAADRALGIARDHLATAIDGSRINVTADSLCVHGDNSSAPAMVRAARARLESAGIPIAPFAA